MALSTCEDGSSSAADGGRRRPGRDAVEQPIVLLKEQQGDRYLPIWIGAVEATAIASRSRAWCRCGR